MISEFIEWLIKFFGWEIKPGVRAVQEARFFFPAYKWRRDSDGISTKVQVYSRLEKVFSNAGCATLLLKGGISWNPEAGAHIPISS